MATPEITNSLTAIIQSCLEDKLQSLYDDSSELTLDLAREVAGAVEAKVKSYTCDQILTLMGTVESNPADLTKFRNFMTSLKSLLGDEVEGYRAFNDLIIDVASVRSAVSANSTILTGIAEELSELDPSLDDHEVRIGVLEVKKGIV